MVQKCANTLCTTIRFNLKAIGGTEHLLLSIVLQTPTPTLSLQNLCKKKKVITTFHPFRAYTYIHKKKSRNLVLKIFRLKISVMKLQEYLLYVRALSNHDHIKIFSTLIGYVDI